MIRSTNRSSAIGERAQPACCPQQRSLGDQHVGTRRRNCELRPAVTLVGDEDIDRRAQAKSVFGAYAPQRQIGSREALNIRLQPGLRGDQRRPCRVGAAYSFAKSGIRSNRLARFIASA